MAAKVARDNAHDAVKATENALKYATFYFSVEVSEVDIARVKVGQTVNLTLDAFSGHGFFLVSGFGFRSFRFCGNCLRPCSGS